MITKEGHAVMPIQVQATSSWVKALLSIAVVQFILLMVVFAVLIDNMQNIQNNSHNVAVTTQRDLATNEVIHKRTQLFQWVYLQTCEANKSRAEPCIIIPSSWWADPKDYPLIVDDPASADLFPPKGGK